jgi:Arylsulfotransferase (ASST)
MTDIQDTRTDEEPQITPEEKPKRGLSRRQFIPRAVGSLAVALGVGGVTGYEIANNKNTGTAPEPVGPTANSIPTAGNPGSGVDSFVSRPDLSPALVRITEIKSRPTAEASPRFIVMAPMADVPYKDLQRGPMLLDRRGRMVWYDPGPDSTFNVQIQSYKGQPVLTRWHGDLIGGYGEGSGQILDETYKTVATVRPEKLPLDLHEFNLTSRGTALATHYELRNTDLSSVGGAANGVLLVGHALEIDIATNKVLLDWVSTDHVGLDESYQPLPSAASDAYDFFHINSIAEAADGNLLISGRNTWTVYKVHRKTGEIMWRLNGKKSDFDLDDNADFSWQHHVRAHGESQITIFDNANISGHSSVALMLDLDEGKKSAKVARAYQHPAKFVSWTLGSVQVRPNGNVFVGWGAQPYFSEFSKDGELLVDGQFEATTRSYRTFLADWRGRPTDKPVMVARSDVGSGFLIYASWNGATEIDHWTVLAGRDPAALQPVGSQPWTGFETTIVVNSEGPLFAVAAMDRDGNELGRSATA